MGREFLKPTFNNVLLRRNKSETTTQAGLIIAGSKDEGSWRATVIAKGPGSHQNGVFVPTAPEIEVGRDVYVPAFNGYRTTVGTSEYLLVKDAEIIATVYSE